MFYRFYNVVVCVIFVFVFLFFYDFACFAIVAQLRALTSADIVCANRITDDMINEREKNKLLQEEMETTLHDIQNMWKVNDFTSPGGS